MNVINLSKILDDAELERQIDHAQEELVSAKPAERRAKWEAMRHLILRRSRAQVERMERQKGLR